MSVYLSRYKNLGRLGWELTGESEAEALGVLIPGTNATTASLDLRPLNSDGTTAVLNGWGFLRTGADITTGPDVLFIANGLDDAVTPGRINSVLSRLGIGATQGSTVRQMLIDLMTNAASDRKWNPLSPETKTIWFGEPISIP